MRAIPIAFLVAALVSMMLTPVARYIGLRLGAVSTPGGRHVHSRTIPRTGGIALLFAFAAPLLGLFLVESQVATVFKRDYIRVAGLLGGAVAMCIVGLWDDTRRLRALYKLLAQIAVAVLAWACGFRIEAVTIPTLGFLPGVLSMGIFALPVTVLWIVGIINAINLIDGLDGLAAGVVFFAALTNLIVAYVTGGAEFLMVPMAAILGAVLGFLVFNFNPARIFMGDSGSYFLGYIIGTTALAGASQKASTAVSLLVPILALGLPIFDTLFAMVRRFLERRPIFSPDRGHVHHRLLDMGITHRRAVLLLYGVSVVCTLAAISVSLGRSWQVGVVILLASVSVFGVIRFAGYYEKALLLRRQRARLRSRDAELLRNLIPDVPSLLGEARSEDDVFLVLEKMALRAEICSLELLEVSGDQETTRFACVHAQFGSPDSPDVLSARYPLGRESLARSAVRFKWMSDCGDVSPQVEILLQIVADITAKTLARIQSQLAAPEVQSAEQPRAAVQAVPASASASSSGWRS